MKNDESSQGDKKIVEAQATRPEGMKTKVDRAAIPAGYTIYERPNGTFEVWNGPVVVDGVYSTVDVALATAISHMNSTEEEDSGSGQAVAKEDSPDQEQVKGESDDQRNSSKAVATKKTSQRSPRR